MPWWRLTRLPLVWLSLVGDLTGSLVAGNVYRYEDHVLEPNVIQYRRVGMWTARDAPARGSPGKPGASSVAIDLQLSRPRAERPGLVQVLVFRSATLTLTPTLIPTLTLTLALALALALALTLTRRRSRPRAISRSISSSRWRRARARAARCSPCARVGRPLP